MSDQAKTAAIIGVFAILALGFLWYTGAIGGAPTAPPPGSLNVNPGGFTQSQTTGQTVVPTTTVETRGLKVGDQYTLTFNHRDALVEATSLAESTNVNSRTLQKTQSGTWTVVSGGSATTLTMGQFDNGLACFTTEPASGQSYVVALQRSKDANGALIKHTSYEDVDFDGNKEMVMCASTENLVPQAQLNGKPDLTINVKWYNENTVTMSSPSDQSSIGTTAGTSKNIEWVITGTAGDATLVREIELKINSTTISKWDEGLSYVTLGGQQYALTSATSVTQDGTNTYYKWKFATSGYQDTAKILEFPQNVFNKDYMTTKMVFSLGSGDKLNHTLTVRSISEADGSNTDVTDSVLMSA